MSRDVPRLNDVERLTSEPVNRVTDEDVEAYYMERRDDIIEVRRFIKSRLNELCDIHRAALVELQQTFDPHIQRLRNCEAQLNKVLRAYSGRRKMIDNQPKEVQHGIDHHH